MVPVLDMRTDVVAVIGRCTTSSEAGAYTIVPRPLGRAHSPRAPRRSPHRSLGVDPRPDPTAQRTTRPCTTSNAAAASRPQRAGPGRHRRPRWRRSPTSTGRCRSTRSAPWLARPSPGGCMSHAKTQHSITEPHAPSVWSCTCAASTDGAHADHAVHETGLAPWDGPVILNEAGLGGRDCVNRATDTGPIRRHRCERPGELAHVNVKKVARVPARRWLDIHGRANDGHRGQGGVSYRFIHTRSTAAPASPAASSAPTNTPTWWSTSPGS